jgi:VWFA-related protein
MNAGRVLSVVLFCHLLVASVFGQQEPSSTPSFRSQTNLVLLPVQVRSHGQHVANLKQDSFTLLQDGKPRKIAVFEEIRTTTQRLQRVAVGPTEFTNELLGSPETARYTIIAIDRINTDSLDLIRVRRGLTDFLSHAVTNGEPIRLISIEYGGIRMIQDFTTDPKMIGAALNRATSGSGTKADQSSVGADEYRQVIATAENSAIEGSGNAQALANLLAALDNAKTTENLQVAFQERSARINSLDALQQIALSVSGLPGRKSLVWASSGYPFASIVRQAKGGVTYDFSQINEAMSLDSYTTHLLGVSNIAVYPIDARGLTNTAWDSIDPSHKYSPTAGEKLGRQQTNQDILNTFDRLADGTGGKACYNRAELAECFKEALEDSRDYYMVGFYVDKGTKNGWHKLQVKVDGANTRSRNGFLFPLPDPEKTHALDMSASLHSLFFDAGIPFRGGWTTTQKKGDKVANAFVLRVEPSANVIDPEQHKLNLEFVGIARKRDGTVAGQFHQTVAKDLPPEAVATIQKEGITYRNNLELPAGEYLVRIVIRDNNTGRSGAANSLLNVQ